MKPRWFKNHVAYTMAKYGMSMCVLGMSEEFKEYGIAVNALWPQTGKSTKKVHWVKMISEGALVSLGTCLFIFNFHAKAEWLQLNRFLPRAVLPIKNLDIEKTNPTFVASGMKNVRLVFFDFQLFL